MEYDVLVIGAGPAGMMAACHAAQRGGKVLLLEKMEQAGRKLRITGKGRCNLTNTAPWDVFAEHVHPQSRFFKPAFFHFSNTDTLAFFKRIGLETVTLRGNRVFPASLQAADVQRALVDELKRLDVTILYYAAAVEFDTEPCGGLQHVKSLLLQNGRRCFARKFILATGALSYPSTGSTGDGYRLASRVGHGLSPCFPVLCALRPRDYDRGLSGISLKNIRLSLYTESCLRREEFGELAFTADGIEGPTGLRLSREVAVALRKGQKTDLVLNLKPALSPDVLQARFAAEDPHRNLAAVLRSYMPQALIPPFLNYAGITGKTRCAALTEAQKNRIPEAMQSWKFTVEATAGYERAVVTAGGIPLSEVRAKTLASRFADNLYFAGEILDLDADTGGYNLQIAFSTGALAGATL